MQQILIYFNRIHCTRFTVSDTGIGMKPEEVKNMCKLFGTFKPSVIKDASYFVSSMEKIVDADLDMDNNDILPLSSGFGLTIASAIV